MRKLYPDSRVPMTEEEHEVFRRAANEYVPKTGRQSREDYLRLSRAAGERAVRRMRGRPVPLEERQADLFAAR